jgi:hypothetical protein
MKIMGKGGFKKVDDWFHTDRSGDYHEAVEFPGYRPCSPPFLRVMKELMAPLTNVFVTDLEGLRQGFVNGITQAYLHAHGENPLVDQLQTLMIGAITQGFSNPNQPIGS